MQWRSFYGLQMLRLTKNNLAESRACKGISFHAFKELYYDGITFCLSIDELQIEILKRNTFTIIMKRYP